MCALGIEEVLWVFGGRSGLNTSTRKPRIATPQTRIGTSPNQRGFPFCGAGWGIDDRLKRKSGKMSKVEEEVVRVGWGWWCVDF
jgi:hypothetical protein